MDRYAAGSIGGGLAVQPTTFSNGRTGAVPIVAIDDAGIASSTSVIRSVPAAVASQQILPANPKRIRDTIVNDSTATMYVLEGTGNASSGAFTYAVAPKTVQPGFYEATDWKGPVQVAWSAADGAARITERS